MLSHLYATPWTVACQTSLSLGFSRQEYWSGLLCPPPGDLPDPGIEPISLMSAALACRFFTTSANWEALTEVHWQKRARWCRIFSYANIWKSQQVSVQQSRSVIGSRWNLNQDGNLVKESEENLCMQSEFRKKEHGSFDVSSKQTDWISLNITCLKSGLGLETSLGLRSQP